MVRRKVGARAHKIREICAGRGREEGICARGKGERVYVGRQRVSMHGIGGEARCKETNGIVGKARCKKTNGIGGKARCKKTNGCGLTCTTQHVNSDKEQEHVTMWVDVHHST